MSVIGLLIRIFRSLPPQTIITLKDDSTISPIHTGQADINYGIPLERHEQLSKDLGVTESALNNFFKIVEKKQVPISELDNTLLKIANYYK